MIVAPRHPRRLVYLGTPEIAVPPLVALYEAGFNIELVVTRTDKRRGRGGQLVPSPVKKAALELGLPVTDDLWKVAALDVDLGVVVAYGRIIPTPILERLAMVNIHFSLLPRWRGAAPLERAILAGDKKTGVCLMEVAEELDTGDLYDVRELELGDKTLDQLRSELVAMGSTMLVENLRDGLGAPVPQQGEVTYAKKIVVEEYQLDLSRSVVHLERVVRLGRAWTTFRGKRLKVLSARAEVSSPDAADAANPAIAADAAVGAVGTLDGTTVIGIDGCLHLETVQPEGRKAIDAASWRNGAQPNSGEKLGS